MYEKFFGIDEPPFRLTPDPRYLYLSAKHREALGHLVYGIHEGAGFVAITGEIGAGKTTLLRSLLSRADDTTQYAYILNPVLTGLELMQEINHELGIPSAGTRREMLSALNHFLLDQKRRGRRVDLRDGRNDRQGQGTAAAGMRDAAPGPDPLHLPASRARSRADGGLDQIRCHLHRL